VRMKNRLLRQLEMKKGSLPFMYLGVPMGLKRIPLRAFGPIVEKIIAMLSTWIIAMLSTWKVKALFFVGRVTLLKTILQSIPIYLMSCR